ncbi:MAG TPA: F0F1 ATP synthase subunit delta [Verrucomicrobiota bacterium]|jgi:F-type H+-transporting ATPase subunit delta|nr:F0F1 ATP synthase subunit delta [Verrucomicrobiota bacterium]HRT07326.1 F0F1 ATP synthase subunit delta [Candidatus Paceibacterota bacterium]
MKVSKQARREAKALFRGCLRDGALDEGRVKASVQWLLERKPRGYLAIAAHFQRLVKLELERRTARVESATPLAPELQAGIQTQLTRLYGAGLNINFVHNPALIGGLRVKVASDVYDGSIQGRLNQLAASF